jgi:hypothetical protein
MKRLALVISAACAAIIGTVAVVGSSGAQSPAPPTGTLELVALDREGSFKFVDTRPRRRENPGDQFILTQRLRDTSNRRVGRAHAAFTFTPGKPAAAQGTGTFILHNGRIAVAGVVDDPGKTDRLAIVGGSGAYTAATGTVLVTERRRSTQFEFTFAG